MNELSKSMGDREKREEMKQIIDFTRIRELSKQISETAQKASELAGRFEDKELAEDQRDLLSEELKTLVEKGSELANERVRLFARHSD